MPKGKISRIQTRPTCTEYKRLFDCAQKKGKIKPVGIMPSWNLPSYLSGSDFVALLVPALSSPSLGGSSGGLQPIPILKPNSYCHKGHYPQNQGQISGKFPYSLNKLRKYSGCGTRPSGSSSRFDGGIDESSSFTKGFVRAGIIQIIVIVAVLWIANKQYKFI